MVSMFRESAQTRLDRLRSYRNQPEQDLSLGFLKKQFKREVEKPYRQLGPLGTLWAELLPQELVAHSRLEGLSRGVLRVAVDSSAHLYELDSLLRNGLERELIRRHKGAVLRKVRLHVAAIDPADPPR